MCVALVLSDSLMIPWTVAHYAPLSMGFSRQEYWSGLSCPPPGDLPDPGRFFTFWATREATFAYLPVLCYSYLYDLELPFFFHADPPSVLKILNLHLFLHPFYLRIRLRLKFFIATCLILVILCHCCLIAKSCLFWDPMDCRLPASSVHGILQARILE